LWRAVLARLMTYLMHYMLDDVLDVLVEGVYYAFGVVSDRVFESVFDGIAREKKREKECCTKERDQVKERPNEHKTNVM
jgi:hypothetical protein